VTLNGAQQVRTKRAVEDVERDAIRDEAKIDLGFELVSTASIFEELPEPKYLVAGVIRRGSVVLLGGYGASSKTWIALALSISVATGAPWLGRFPCEQGRSSVLDWESGSYELRRRLQRIAVGMKLGALTAGIDFATMPDSYMGTEKFKKALAKLAPHRDLVIIDSLRAASPGAEENDSAIRQGLDQLRAIAEKTGCSFVVIVHARKTSQSPSKPDPREVLRGSSAIFDAADAVLTVTVSAKGEPLRVEQTKSRHGKDIAPFGVTVADTPLGTGVVLEAVDIEADEKPTGSKRFQQVCEMVEKVIRASPGSSARFVHANLDQKAHWSTFAAALEQLSKLGRVVNLGTAQKQEWRPADA
jgi:hypothetical protein